MLRKCYALVTIIGVTIIMFSCAKENKSSLTAHLEGDTWAEKLGFAPEERVIILHADDVGMCREANEAAKTYLSQDLIQSASIMVPCAWSDQFMIWYKTNSKKDVGLHLTLTSEWQTYRWGSVADPEEVPGLLDPDGFLWRDVLSVVKHATAQEVEKEIRAQIEKALSNGVKPGHIDTHMGTVYAKLDFSKVYLNIAMEYDIPAMVIQMTESIAGHFREQGYPITDELIKYTESYTLPKLDAFYSVAGASSYDEKKQNFYHLIQSIKPGITEIIFHPSIESDTLKSITNSWQQRVWEAQMFSDPEVIQFFKEEGIVFTNWKLMLDRFRERI